MAQYLPSFPALRRELHDEEDLASVALQIQRKRFYVDVKKNCRGVYMKIVEVGADGRKQRILLTLSAALEIKNKLKDLIDVLDDITKKEESEAAEGHDGAATDGLIKSHIVNYPFRRYFLDLKRNKRGHFLRLTMLSTLNRIQVAVPSQGMVVLYDAINELLNRWWDGSQKDELKGMTLPESRSLRVDNRTLYFDSSCNRFGTYLRISEVRTSSRTAITIPGRSIFRFRDIINGLAEDLIKARNHPEIPSVQLKPEEDEGSSTSADADSP